MSPTTFQEENIRTLWAEVYPLLVKHWVEIASDADITLAPDIALYEALSDAGMLRVYTARVDAQLVGYAAYVVRPHIHYRDSLQAQQDVLFVLPEHRRGLLGVKLIRYADEQLTALGVQKVYQHVKVAHDFGPVLERLGYTLIERIYARRLD